tara:strand:+ start:2514 stop:3650 length:1137 start_codon:yes stop_codon:yes gene_type:complete
VPDNTPQVQAYLGRASVDDAMYEALGMTRPKAYQGQMSDEEPEPNIDMDVLQGALQPDPITTQPLGKKVPSVEEAWGLRPRNPAELAASAIGKILGKQPKTVDGIRKKSELEYFLDAQPETELYDFFKYVPDAHQISNYLEGRKLRKQGLDSTVLEDGTDPRNLGGAEGYGSLGTPATSDAGLMTRPKARPEDLAEKTAAITAAKVKKDKLINSVFKAEGGYSTDKDDTGNYYNGKFVGTNHGISAPALAKELGRDPTVADMKALTKTEARQIAGDQYFDRFSIDKLPDEVQEIVLHATYMGESRGVRAMQNLLGLTPDGVMGPNTRMAMQNADFTKEEYKDEYLRELQFGTVGYSKPSATWNKHGKGWTNRYTKLAK